MGFHPREPAIGINGNGNRRGIYFLLTRNGDGEPDIEFTEKNGCWFDRSTDRVEMYKESQEIKEILYRFIGMFDEFEKEFYSYIDNLK